MKAADTTECVGRSVVDIYLRFLMSLSRPGLMFRHVLFYSRVFLNTLHRYGTVLLSLLRSIARYNMKFMKNSKLSPNKEDCDSARVNGPGKR